MFVLSLWLLGWGAGAVAAGRELLFGESDAPDLFVPMWLSIWILAGGCALFLWLWMAVGREVLVLHSNALVHATFLGIPAY